MKKMSHILLVHQYDKRWNLFSEKVNSIKRKIKYYIDLMDVNKLMAG